MDLMMMMTMKMINHLEDHRNILGMVSKEGMHLVLVLHPFIHLILVPVLLLLLVFFLLLDYPLLLVRLRDHPQA